VTSKGNLSLYPEAVIKVTIPCAEGFVDNGEQVRREEEEEGKRGGRGREGKEEEDEGSRGGLRGSHQSPCTPGFVDNGEQVRKRKRKGRGREEEGKWKGRRRGGKTEDLPRGRSKTLSKSKMEGSSLTGFVFIFPEKLGIFLVFSNLKKSRRFYFPFLFLGNRDTSFQLRKKIP
jgi:hypothetical protein